MFKIALLNPLRFIDTSNVNSGFDGNFAVEQLLSYQNPKCYAQKWQNTDFLKLQVLSDFAPTELLIRELATNRVIVNIPWEEKPTQIIGHTFKVYELSQSMNIAAGRYYAQFSYDDGAKIHVLLSELFEVKVVQSNTLLIKYKNSENDIDVIFDTGIEFQFRVEGAVKYEAPGNNRNVFNDQMVNPTLLSATPYRKFKLFIGFKEGVPFWVQDKVNTIITVDQVSYNNEYYQTPAGSEWETEKDDFSAFIGSSIEVYPTDNNFAKFETTPINEDKEFIPMQKVLKYLGVSANVAIAGKFKAFSLLEHICIVKRTPADFILNIGTTDGGIQLGQFNINQNEKTCTIEELFTGNTTVYLTGVAGADVDIFVVYKQLDEEPIPIAQIGGNNGIKEGKNSVKVYHELQDGEFELHWDIATGLGRVGTAFEGWAWMDGRNGTPNWKKRIPIMFDQSDPNWDLSKLGTPVGNQKFKLEKNQLPAVGVSVFAPHVRGASNDIPGPNDFTARARSRFTENLNYEIVKCYGTPSVGRTGNLGDGNDIDITPNGIIALWIIKITD